MPNIEPLLNPISEDKPSGDDLKFFKAPLDSVPLFDKIRNARKMEDKGPQGMWATDSSPQDFGLIIKWITEALSTKTKDLQLAAWLTEAWTHKEGAKGLAAGLDLLREFVVRFWDSVYPELDEGDAEPRAAPLDWVGSYFDPAKMSSPIFALRSVSLSQSGYTYFNYQESRQIGYEADVSRNPQRKAVRDAAIKDGKVVPEAFDKDFESTKKAHFKELQADLKTAQASLAELDTVCHEKFADVAPSFSPLRKALEEVANVVHILLVKKLEKDPDPVEPDPSILAAAAEEQPRQEAEAGSAPDGNGTAAQSLDLSQLESGAIKNEAQAVLHAVAAAQFIRRQNPASPTSYLLLRALRWGELRSAADIKQADLPAPAADIRRALRTAAATGNWKGVLESAETAMSNTCGRGWLDLQRYSIRAATELGYGAAAKAIRSELKSLLVDFPDLTKATLNDDTGAANPETMDWLKQEGLI